MKDEYRFSRQQIGGREFEAEGTTRAKAVRLGVGEKLGVNGAQRHVIDTKSGEQGCSLSLGQMFLSFYLQGTCYWSRDRGGP